MEVREVMTAPVHTLPANSSVQQAYEIMKGRAIRHLPIVDSNGGLLGMLSHRDVQSVVVEMDGEIIVPSDSGVESIMTKDPMQVEPDSDIRVVLKALREHRFGAVSVTEAGRVVGIVSYVDLLDLLAQILDAD